jgi:hypothetical protein
MGALRYLLFVVVGVVVASLLFVALNLVVSANLEAGTGLIERWILRATCDEYELSGTVRDTSGHPVPYAVVEASFYDERLTTRSRADGTFALKANEAVCDRAPPGNVSVLVLADNYRPKRHSVPFTTDTLDVALDARDFRP